MSDRLLVLRIGALGDVIDTAIAVAQIKKKRPELKIDWVVKSVFAPIIKDYCDDVIELSSKTSWFSFIRQLRQRKYTAAIDFHGNFRSSVITYLSHSDKRYGFDVSNSREGASFFYSHKFKVEPGIHSRIDDGLALSSYFLDEPLKYQALDMVESPEEALFAKKELQQGHDIVLVTSSSPKGYHKMWPQERWRSFIEKSPDSWKFTLIWGPGEEESVQTIAHGFGDKVQISPPTKLKELEALLRHCRLVIGADTGPMHMAHVLGKPTIVLFGPKDPKRYGPQYNNYRVIYEKQKCSPCRNWKCDHISCMWAIDTGSVIQAVHKMLEGEL